MRKWSVTLLLFLGVLRCQHAHAVADLPVSSALANIPAMLEGGLVKNLVTTVGVVFDHRPFEPATPLGVPFGFDVGLEVEVIQIPQALTDSFASQGFNIPIPDIPSARELNVHKGIANQIDIGASVLVLRGYTSWGVELKYAFVHPEEGPTWAIRLSRNETHIPIGSASLFVSTVGVAVDTVTWTPELVVSKKLDFADPYIGIGYQYITGGLILTTESGPVIPGLNSVTTTGNNLFGFLGLSLKVPQLGFHLTLEMAYSPSGYNYLGTKIGFGF